MAHSPAETGVDGHGRVQLWGGSIQQISFGDVVWIPAGLKHWHGAAPDSSMTHIALQENSAGKAVEWLEKTTKEHYQMNPTIPQFSRPDLADVSPALASWTESMLYGEVWNRPGLSRRDRSLVTLAALVARRQEAELPAVLDMALASGVKPAEISELIAHLAFYSGWPNALAAVEPTRAAFARAGIVAESLPAASVSFLPLDEAAEEKRRETVSSQFSATAPALVQYTTDILFRNLWLRPGLAPRDRSLTTVSALIASGQVAQIPFHLGRAMDNGLTHEEAAEMVTQLAFYVGWPNAMSALPVMKDVFEKRSSQ